ncbi:uncharacterized protein ACLA_097900 [Aspergillus clavatus NRRL 1]|uniref:alpha-galactosidase n=1 Tax=Aspergillus clavatus (strain ATCC 1007 / CBS 513.65 / DSM 816 / NCTC 3887 / NRRL 1 / QM 1276 / 107) TaxID=344612 RepID=A1CMR1_ASPCL|nr:uncharacterized protein ACLA_097900 [Aspergillus clavatus NRRL 1]EAW08848.1 hypothetical protein ACLA_097900 [Aspergillus clavatus NRRL 1]
MATLCWTTLPARSRGPGTLSTFFPYEPHGVQQKRGGRLSIAEVSPYRHPRCRRENRLSGFQEISDVVLGDCWSAGRNTSGYLIVNSAKFPNGIAELADRIHDIGLKIGIYSSAGSLTCSGYAGSLGLRGEGCHALGKLGGESALFLSVTDDMVAGGETASQSNLTALCGAREMFAKPSSSSSSSSSKELMGSKVGTVQLSGTVRAHVKPHGVAMLRLRAREQRDEL